MAQTTSIAPELQRAVSINEEIKDVVGLAARLNLLAFNARLVARRSGDAARGFGQVSEELRTFGRGLAARMETLQAATFASVDTTSALLKQTKIAHILHGAAAEPQAGRALQAALARTASAVHARTAALARAQRALGLELDDVQRLAELGCSLACIAKIEAVYGGTYNQDLTQVADAFARCADHMMAALTRLRQYHTTHA